MVYGAESMFFVFENSSHYNSILLSNSKFPGNRAQVFKQAEALIYSLNALNFPTLSSSLWKTHLTA